MIDNNANYLMGKGGVYYFIRPVPNDLQRRYEKLRIFICLKTRNKNAALNSRKSLAGKLDDFWLNIRTSELEVPASRFLIKGQPKESFTSYVLKLSHALEKYYRLKDVGSCKQFYVAANRNIGYVIEHLGDRPLDIVLLQIQHLLGIV